MVNLTIEIPREILKGGGNRRLLVVDPKEFAKDLRRNWETGDAINASKLGRREHKLGRTKISKSLSILIK